MKTNRRLPTTGGMPRAQMPHGARGAAGFTLLELGVVMIIMAIVAAITVPVVRGAFSGRNLGNGARTLQAVLASARERAQSNNAPFGIRLLPDEANRELVRSYIFIRQADPITLGKVMVVNDFNNTGDFLTDVGALPDNPIYRRVILVSANPAQFRVLSRDANGVFWGVMRIGKSGPYRRFYATQNWLNANPPFVKLTEALTAAVPPEAQGATNFAQFKTVLETKSGITLTDAQAEAALPEYEVPRGAVPVEDAEPISLPAGVVIDLGQLPPNHSIAPDPSTQRLSHITPDPLTGTFDVLVSPDGQVIGSAAADPQVILWLREEQEVIAEQNPSSPLMPSGLRRKEINTASTGSSVLVVLYSRTGFVNTSDPVLLDLNNDGFYDFDPATVGGQKSGYFINVAKGAGTGL